MPIKSLCLPILFIFFISLSFFGASGVHADEPGGNAATGAVSTEKAEVIAAVRPDERALADKINADRQAGRLGLLKPDWDLFRLARARAEAVVHGRSGAIDGERVTRLLEGMGLGERHIVAAVFRTRAGTDSDNAAADPQLNEIMTSPRLERIGVGCVADHEGTVWVVFAEEK